MLGVALAERDGVVSIERVAAGTPAHAAGLTAGEVILGIDGEAARSASAVRARMADVREGDEVVLLLRAADRSEREVRLEAAPKPVEDHAGCTVAYDVIAHDEARLRRIIVAPSGVEGGAPWVLYLQGHGAASIDGGAHPARPLPALAAAFARRGIAFVRVDRPGAGDSEGPSMREIGLASEIAMYRTAVRECRRHPALASDRGVLLAHSLGGVVGAALAADDATRPRGMIVYGGGAKTWTEYFDENARRQWSLSGVAYVEQDRALRAIQRFHALAIVARRPLDEVRAVMPEIADEPTLFGLEAQGADGAPVMRGRPLDYWRDVQDAPVAAQLAAARIPVLAAWGASDWLATRDDHELVAACVNEGAPGSDALGEFVEVPGADHYFAARDGLDASFRARDAGVLAESVVDACAGWMERRGL